MVGSIFLVCVAIASVLSNVVESCTNSTYQKYGCYEENLNGKILLNNRNNDPKQLSAFVKSLACKCEQKAKAEGFSHFSISLFSSFGICVGLNYDDIKVTPAKSNCKDTFLNPCDDLSSTECLGAESSDYIYLVGQDGGYSEWSDWGECSVSCGSGFSQRSRECNNPVKLGNGNSCTVLGPSTETRSCGIKCVIDGGFSEWSDFSSCSATCGGGFKTRTRECNNPIPENGGKDCDGLRVETLGCNKDFCLETCSDSTYEKKGCYEENLNSKILLNNRKNHSTPLPVFVRSLVCQCQLKAKAERFSHFSISLFSSFGVCVGFNIADLTVTPTQNNCRDTSSKICDDTSSFDCLGAESSDYLYLVGEDGGYSEWSDWGECSVSCGSGFAQRSRECNNPVKSGNGKSCTVLGPSTETKSCNVTCAIDGGFSEWSGFSPCSATCGGGFQTRTRECNNPTPKNGGKDCDGLKVETLGCKNDFCLGADGVAKAQSLVEGFLTSFYISTNPGKSVSGKSLKAIFEIQKAVAAEFISVDPTSRKPVDTLLKELEEFLLKAAKGGSIDFARVTLGKSLFNLMKKEIANGLAIDEMNTASEEYLKQIKSQIGDEKFSRIMSSDGGSTLMFVMDTTGSMSDEINAAKGIANSIISSTRKFPVDYILSPFNDPDAGPAIYKSEKQQAEVIDAISNLRIEGGGDCPELAFTGMLNAFNKGPQYSSPMFVFTDASAKDDSKSNMDALKAAATSSSSPITFFANLDGCGSGIDSFKEIASYTSGLVFPLLNDKEILSFTEYVKSSLQQDTVVASGEILKSRFKRQIEETTQDFVVDDGLEKIIVSISASVQNAAGLVKLHHQDGSFKLATTTTSMASIYQISYSDKSFFGKWTLTFPSSTAEYKYSVQAISRDPIEFAYSFIYQQNPAKNSPAYSFNDPIKGQENNMVIRVGGNNVELSSLKCQIVNLKGSIISDLLLIKQESDMFSAKLTPPDLPFKMRCYGSTKHGNSFQRVSNGLSKAKSAFMIPIFAGNMFTAPSSGIVDVQLMVFNFGAEESITFSVKSTHGRVELLTSNLVVRRTAFLLFKYSAPSDPKLVGATERLTVSAQCDVTKEDFTVSFNILIV